MSLSNVPVLARNLDRNPITGRYASDDDWCWSPGITADYNSMNRCQDISLCKGRRCCPRWPNGTDRGKSTCGCILSHSVWRIALTLYLDGGDSTFVRRFSKQCSPARVAFCCCFQHMEHCTCTVVAYIMLACIFLGTSRCLCSALFETALSIVLRYQYESASGNLRQKI